MTKQNLRDNANRFIREVLVIDLVKRIKGVGKGSEHIEREVDVLTVQWTNQMKSN